MTEMGLEPNPHSDFVGEVAERAGLSRDDAKDLVPEFLETIRRFAPEVTSAQIVDLIPPELRDRTEEKTPVDDPTIRDFFLELAEDEDVTARRAARHARAVASTISDRAESQELEGIKSGLPAELADLFE